MSKQKIAIGAMIILIIIAITGIRWSIAIQNVEGQFPEEQSIQQQQLQQESQEQQQISFTISQFQEKETYNLEWESEKTVWEYMKQLQKEEKIAIQQTEGHYGVFIEGLNKKQNNKKEGTYWFLYQNERSASVGAGALVPEKGDSIEWKYQKSR